MAVNEPTKFNGIELLNRLANSGVDPAVIVPSVAIAPTVTTSKLYNLNGVLTFDGVNLEAAGGGGSGDLDSVYSNGQAITVDQGTIVLTDATAGTLDTFRITKSGAGSGDSLEFLHSAAATGRAIYLDMDLAIARTSILIDSGGTARTGPDIQFTDDSTGAHSCIDINSSGSGASIGFDFVGSFNGSPAGHVLSVVFDASDNLDTQVLQVTTGTGDRSVMFNLDLGHTDAGTTSHIFDIDVTAILDSNIFDFATSAACTGNVFNLVMDNAIAATALRITGAGVRTQPYVELITTDTGAVDLIDLSVDGAFTGDVAEIDMNAGVGARALHIDAGAAARTAALIAVTLDGTFSATLGGTFLDLNVSQTGAAASALFDIDLTAIYTGAIFDFATSAASTGTVFVVNMTNAIAAIGTLGTLAGARTADWVNIDDAGTSTAIMFDINRTGASSGIMFDIDVSGISSGNVIDINHTVAATNDAVVIAMASNVEGSALVLSGAGARTDDLIKIDDSSTGNSHIFDINISGAYTGNIFDVVIGAVAFTGDVVSIDLGDTQTAGQLIVLDAGASARTTDAIALTDDGTSTGDLVSTTMGGTGSGNTFDLNVGAVAWTGDVLNVDLGATAVGSQALVVSSGAMLRTTSLVSLTDSGTSSGALVDLNVSGVVTGIVIDIDLTAAATGTIFDFASSSASTGTVFEINMTNAVGARLATYTSAGTRTANLLTVADSSAGAVDIFQIDDSGSKSGHVFDVNVSGANTGNVLDIVYSASAVDGNALRVDMATNLAGSCLDLDGAGARTDDYFQIDDASTSNSHVFDINVSGNSTGNTLDIVYSVSAVQGHAIHVDMGTDLAGNAFLIDAAGVRTAPLINIVNTATDGGTDDHVILITQSGLLDSNLVQLTFGTAASTGEAISITMDTNVAGRALFVSSAGTGVSGEGCVFDVEHTGALVAGADAVTVHSTSNLSATSNLVAIEQDTGAGTAGASALYISATGTNVEAVEINAGIFFEATVALATGAGNGETIATSANVAFYDCGGAGRTGVILAAGLRDGQRVHVVNVSDAAETITFAAAGTSNVALGASSVIEQNTGMTFIWSGSSAPAAAQNLWFADVA